MSEKYVNPRTGETALLLKGCSGVVIKGKNGNRVVSLKRSEYPQETTPGAYWRNYLKSLGFKEEKYVNR